MKSNRCEFSEKTAVGAAVLILCLFAAMLGAMFSRPGGAGTQANNQVAPQRQIYAGPHDAGPNPGLGNAM